ncbi:MerR family transcriptional regulator [Nonomuraea sediminis]|uniref:MerR family transcriptional regulator n=1 Tax=Nonomuraea sediminis TaxID=2835864 RepID=UPI001BDC4D95|nr:MerR family transcriptional regulator [Nonomuraea sediminis]
MTVLRSSQLAQAAGVNPQTLRYYERRGLLPKPDRTLGGHRQYPAETVTLLRAIKAAQRLGFSLDEVADLLGHHHGNLQEQARVKLAEVEERIIDLQATAGTLRTAIHAGCDDLVACAKEPRCPLPLS